MSNNTNNPLEEEQLETTAEAEETVEAAETAAETAEAAP